MLALSVPQPYAHLIAIGARRYEARTWTPTVPVRIAIHAGARVPPFQVLADAERDPWARQAFAREGWRDRDALVALPRSAVVGTVEVVRIVQAADLGATPGLVGAVEESDWLWELADPVAIEPVTGVKGRLNLWELDERVAQAVADAETRARASGFVPAAFVPEAVEAPRTPRWIDEKEAFWTRMREWLDDMPPNERTEWPPKQSEFRSTSFESLFRRVLDGYYATHQRRGEGAKTEVAIDRRRDELRVIFGSRAWVKCAEFEEKLRLALYYEGADVDPAKKSRADARRGPVDNWEAYGEFKELDRFVEADDDSGIGHPMLESEDFPKHAGGRPRKEEE